MTQISASSKKTLNLSSSTSEVRVLGGTSARCEAMLRVLDGCFARGETVFAFDGGSSSDGEVTHATLE